MKESKIVKPIASLMILLLSMIMIFHFLVLSGIIPYSIVWGGRLNSTEQMIVFEVISILTNAIMLLIVAVRGHFLHWKVKPILIRLALFLMAGLFLLNTLGNIMSKNAFEKAFFTPQTLVLGLMCLTLAICKSEQE